MRGVLAGSSPPMSETEMKKRAPGSNLICIRVDQVKDRQLLRTKLIQLLAPSSCHGLLPKADVHDSVSHTWHQVRGERSHSARGTV